MKTFLKKKRFALITALLLTGFTAYALLDTFVIPRGYTVVSSAVSSSSGTAAAQEEAASAGSGLLGAASADTEADAETAETVKEASTGRKKRGRSSSGSSSGSTGSAAEGASEAAAAQTAEGTVVTADTYSDENVTVTLTQTRYLDTTVYVADVQLASAAYLKTAFAQNTYGKNVKDETSAIAAQAGAILAVNGDYYGARNSGYVIRNGVLYRDKGSGAEDLVIWADGSFSVISEDEVTAQELLDAGAVQVLSFGPALIEDGQIAITTDEEVGRAMASNPRTAVGIIDEGHYVFVVSDGRTDESEGLSLYELAQFMQGLGVTTAYNLDGGGSSTMVFNGSVINNPTTSGNSTKERSVSDIVYIGY